MAAKKTRTETADKPVAGARRDDESDAASRRAETSNDSTNSTYRTVMTADGVPIVIEERGAPQGRAARRR